MPDAATEDPPPEAADGPKKVSQTSKSSTFHPKSETSTERYEQAPFEEHKVRVQELCHLLWPHSNSNPKEPSIFSEKLRGASNSRILGMLRRKKPTRVLEPKVPKKHFLIERMAGGSYNRITGVTIIEPDGRGSSQLILRVPRFDWEASPDREVAVLRYVHQHTSIPVPEVITADFSSNNPLKLPYVVQQRIPGISIAAAPRERELTTEQWCTVAREVGRTVLALQKITNPTPGFIEASSAADGSYNFSVSPFDIETLYDSEWKKRAASVTAEQKALILDCYKESTSQFLVTQFGRWMADELTRRPDRILSWDFMYRLAQTAAQMGKYRCLGDDTNCLTHLDLAGRNIMAEFHADESLSITGILDWDSAMFVPHFVACAPPWWLWQDENDSTDYQEDETKASETPQSPLNQAIKRAFEETVGEEFLFYAYEPQFRIARKLFHISMNGCNSNTQLKKVETVLDEWAVFYKAEVEPLEAEIDDASMNEGDGSSKRQVFQECENLE